MKLSDLLYGAFTTLGAEIHGAAGDIKRGVVFPNIIYIEGGWRTYRRAQDVMRRHGIDSWGQQELVDNFQFSADADADDVAELLNRNGIKAWRR